MTLRLFIVAIGLLFILQAEAMTEKLEVNQSSLSIAMKDLNAEAGRMMGRRLDKKSSRLHIQLAVPAGYAVALRSVEYKGAATIPAGGMARLETITALKGIKALEIKRILDESFDEVHAVAAVADQQNLVWSSCGGSADLSLDSSILVQANNRLDAASSEAGGVTYQLVWKKCQQQVASL